MSQPAPDTPRSQETPTLETGNSALQPVPSTLAPPPSSLPAAAAAAGPSRYRPTRFHARGGLGEVHVAVDVELKRDVALKQMRPERADDAASRQRFLLEAEVTGRLEHPGVVPVYGLAAYPDGRPYYAMRFIKGESLASAIKGFHTADRPGRDPGERSLALRGLLRRFIDVCNAVGYAHSKGVLHRDLKPDNVMLGPFGETLVVDWGLAKLLGEVQEATAESGVLLQSLGSGSSTDTQQGAVVGTVQYMSPEQAAAKNHELTPATDIYALGAILYCVLTGRPPFEKNSSVMEMIGRVVGGKFPPPRAVKPSASPALEAVCLKAMSQEPAARYATAKDLAADVDHWLGDEPVTAYCEPLPARVRRWGRRHRTLVSSAVVLLVTATAALSVATVVVNAARANERTAREAEQKANGELKAALEREVELKKSATEQSQLALETMRAVRMKIDARLRDIPALRDLRKELLQQAKEGLDKVARAADTAGKIDHETLGVHFELGDIALALEGATEKAKAEYELAYQLAQKLASADPTGVRARRDLSISVSKIGAVQKAQGDLKRALASCQECQKIFQKLASADPTSVRAQRDLSISVSEIGDVQQAQGDLRGALASYQDCQKISQELADRDPTDAEVQHDLSDSFERIGNVQLAQGDLKRALASYQECQKIFQKLAAADPTSGRAQRAVSLQIGHIGQVQQAQGDLKGALASYRECQKTFQKLAAADPTNARAQRDLSIYFAKIGEVQQAQADLKGALASYEEFHKISRKLAAADPTNAQAQLDLAGSFGKIGEVLQAQGDLKGALASYDEAHKMSRKLAAADSTNAQTQRNLAGSFSKIGEVQQAQGDLKGALASYQECLKIRERLAATDPTSARAQRDLSISFAKIGEVQQAQEDLKGALASYHEFHKMSRKLAAADPTSAQTQRDLSVSFERIGVVQQAQGDLRGALASYQDSLKIRQKLAAADPNSALVQRDLSVSSEKIGDVQQAQRDLKGALASYQDSLKIRQKLAAADPRNAQAQRDLFVSHDKLGDVQLQLGDTRAALEAYRAGLAIREKLADADPRNAQAQRDLLISFAKLGLFARSQAEFQQSEVWFEKALDVAQRSAPPDYFARDIQNLRRDFNWSRAAADALADLSTLHNQPEAMRAPVLTAVVDAHVRRKEPDRAVAAADLLARNGKQAGEVYDAACGVARCVPLADKPEVKERYAARAVALLKQAVEKGYKDAAHMKKDPDLDALRQRDDFKVLLKELETTKPETPNQQQ